jgi:hypothetical protein
VDASALSDFVQVAARGKEQLWIRKRESTRVDPAAPGPSTDDEDDGQMLVP